MNIEEIKELIKAIDNSGITELDLELDSIKIRLVKNAHELVQEQDKIAYADSMFNQGVDTGSKTDSGEEAINNPNTIEIRSPMVGTFYLAPSPTSEPFVIEGTQISKGQDLCIIEAMKVMNEIESDYSGRLLEILVENGQAVEYGQPLFVIELAD